MTKVENIGVVGAGIMGSGIAQVAAQAGYQVIMNDIEGRLVEHGLNTIKNSLGSMIERKKMTTEEANNVLARIRGTSKLKELTEEADLIVETISEDLELKKQLFKDLDAMCPPPIVLATNTSSLSITVIASVTKTPERVIGMHFSNPAPQMMGVELIKGLHTSQQTLKTAKEVCGRMGKKVFIVADFPGFCRK